MRSVALLILVPLMLLTAGCAVRGDDDPFGYMRKPLYANNFDLSTVQGANATHEFWVSDGSIGRIQTQVWVNNTAGDARVVLRDPSGAVVMETTTSRTASHGLDLGAWSVTVEGSADATGDVGIHVTRM